MIIRALNPSGDWTFGSSRANYLTYNPAIAQSIQSRVSSFIGDCFFDMGAGIDWFTFLGGSRDSLGLQLAISAVILNTFGILKIKSLSFNLDRNSRRFSISYNVTTIFSGTLSQSILILTDESGNPLADENGNILIA